MKVLIIGNADSMYVKAVIEKTLLPYNDSVSILSGSNKTYQRYYNSQGVQVYLNKRFFSGNGKLCILLSMLSDLRVFRKRYDVVCIHFVTSPTLCMLPFINIFSNKIIASYWGRDFFSKKEGDRLTGRMLKYADKVTFITEQMREQFLLNYGVGFKNKVSIADFGLEALEYIRNHKEKYEALREEYNIPKDKIVVSIGYNSNPNQQHHIVLDVINSLNDNERKSIHILVRMTYGGGSEEYIKSIKDKVRETKCTYTYFESFMSAEQLAKTTEITDVFIQAQDHDARSGSMLEHFYAECLVVNPEWLDYGDMKNKLFYLSYNNSATLKNVITNNLYKKKSSPYLDKLRNNASVVTELSSWDKWIPVWRALYTL